MLWLSSAKAALVRLRCLLATVRSFTTHLKHNEFNMLTSVQEKKPILYRDIPQGEFLPQCMYKFLPVCMQSRLRLCEMKQDKKARILVSLRESRHATAAILLPAALTVTPS